MAVMNIGDRPTTAPSATAIAPPHHNGDSPFALGAGESARRMDELRVFLADDHAVVRDGLKTLINAQPDLSVVGEAEDGATAVERIRALQPDVVVMDVSMPHGNGAETTAKVISQFPHMKVLALSMHEDRSYLRSLLEAGASGYILKRSAADELIRAIRAVAAGRTYLDPSLSATMVDGFVRGKQPLRGEVEGATLSEREAEVLRLIAQGYTNKEIGTQLFISVKTVETYKARSMEKLSLDSRADIVRYALIQGWLHSSG
jgi:two-component system response regulator NreC